MCLSKTPSAVNSGILQAFLIGLVQHLSHDGNAIEAARRMMVDRHKNSIEVSVRGRWVNVPALHVNDQTFVVTGKWIKIASLHDEDWLESELTDPDACVRAMRDSCEARPDIFSFAQKLPAILPKWRYPFDWHSSAVARISSFKDWWEHLPQEGRKNVRRSGKRGVLIGERPFGDELIRGISEIQNESPVRQGRRYPHYGKTLDEVRRDYSAFVDRSDFICAHCENEMIGFLQLVYRGDVASILQLSAKVAHHDKRPSNALLARAVELCEAKKVKYLTYGKFNYGNKGDNSLRDFKSRNGFEEVLVPRFYVPLTGWGHVCVKSKLYRGIVGVLPRNVIAIGSKARAEWYRIRYSKAGVAQC